MHGKCSVGLPSGPGTKIGYAGWGRPDILLDPALPLDMQVERLGLCCQFEEVACHDLLHRLHGDCTLTHGVYGISSLLKQGGTLKMEFLSLQDVASVAIGLLGRGNIVLAQMAEKHCFGQAVDTSGVLYPQTFISEHKLSLLLSMAGMEPPTYEKKADKSFEMGPPDILRLDGISDKVWDESALNFAMGEGLRLDRPTCVACDRVVTKRDHDRRCFSRYCKDHYHEARSRYDAAARQAFSVRASSKKARPCP